MTDSTRKGTVSEESDDDSIVCLDEAPVESRVGTSRPTQVSRTNRKNTQAKKGTMQGWHNNQSTKQTAKRKNGEVNEQKEEKKRKVDSNPTDGGYDQMSLIKKKYAIMNKELRALEKKTRQNFCKRKEPIVEIEEDAIEDATAKSIRKLRLDFAENKLVEQYGEINFNYVYPFRDPTKRDVHREGTLRLKRIEKRWNGINRSWGLPDLLLEDWTDQQPNDIELSRILFDQECSFTSKEVEEMAGLLKHRSAYDKDAEEGRKKELLIFRDHLKGWSLRAVTEFKEGEYITFYNGEIGVGPSSGVRRERYDFRLDSKVKTAEGWQPLYVNCSKKANEGRFFPHSCNANVESETTVTERRGKRLSTIAFRASRDIERGEELSIDYFPRQTLDSGCNTSSYFEYCRCGSVDCRFSEEKVREHKEKTEEAKRRKDEKDEIKVICSRRSKRISGHTDTQSAK